MGKTDNVAKKVTGPRMRLKIKLSRKKILEKDRGYETVDMGSGFRADYRCNIKSGIEPSDLTPFSKRSFRPRQRPRAHVKSIKQPELNKKSTVVAP